MRYQVAMMESALQLCRDGRAAAYLPSFVAQLQNEGAKKEFALREIPSPRGLSAQGQPVYVVRRREDPEDAHVKRIARVLREACRHP